VLIELLQLDEEPVIVTELFPDDEVTRMKLSLPIQTALSYAAQMVYVPIELKVTVIWLPLTVTGGGEELPIFITFHLTVLPPIVGTE
jgi:hypothetical protein